MISEEFITACVERGISRELAIKYIRVSGKDYFTEYDIKVVREAADYGGRLSVCER